MERFEKALNVIVASAALVIAVIVARRELGSQPREYLAQSARPPAYLAEWRDFRRAGREIGDSLSPVQVVEFIDFECPFCRRYDLSMQRIEQERTASVSRVVVHFPLRGHRFALPAARASECGAAQGRFREIHDLLLLQQDSFGLKPWTRFASDAGVDDTVRFARCLSETTQFDLIDRGVALASTLELRGTPAVVVNGWRYDQVPADADLRTLLDSIQVASGKRPR